MRCFHTQEEAFKFLEWILFITFIIMAGSFSSGVLHQFFSQKTSFAQHEEEIHKYPVASIHIYCPASEANLDNVMINYGTTGMPSKGVPNLEIGKNYLHNDQYNQTEEVILESLENQMGERVFRIIHVTQILEREKRPDVSIRIKTKLKNQSDLVIIYLTSKENSPGFYDWIWKDGKPLTINLNKNAYIQYSIQPQMTKYLESLGKCQEAPYYECIASQIDVLKDCANKCIPKELSIVEKNYSTAFCQDDRNVKYCIFDHKQEIKSNCKKSCSHLEYFGEISLNMNNQSDEEDWNIYHFSYVLTNQDFTYIVNEQYLIYDVIGMIGSVGGTVGTFTKYYVNS